jgi:hypothetical protein
MAGDSNGSQGLFLYNANNPVAGFGTPAGSGYGMQLYDPATGSGTQSVAASPAFTADGTTHILAVHFQLGQTGANNAVTLFLDPDAGSLGGAAPTGGATATYTTARDFAFDQVVLANFSRVNSG